MNEQNIHPIIKESLRKQVNKKAPQSLSKNIMNQIMALHKAKFAVPNYDGIVLFGLLLCVVFVAIPYLAPSGFSSISTLTISLPQIPMWVYTSICVVIMLVALDNIYATLKLKKA